MKTKKGKGFFGSQRALLIIVLGVLLALALPGCRYPQDIEHTMERLQGGALEVGLTENPPWVIRREDGPAGLEPDIIRSLAERLNAEIRWHWGSEDRLLAALQHRQLDLVIGGLTNSSRLSQQAALTSPYYQSRYTVGFPSGIPLPTSLEGLEVAIPPVNHMYTALKERNAKPIKVANITRTEGPVAGPTWWFSAHGLVAGPWEIITDKQVMALPKGENAWMLALQRHLNGYSNIEQRLQQLEATQ